MRYSAWNRRGGAIRLPPWRIALLLVITISLGIAVAIVATGVFLIALPIVALVVLAYRLFGGARRRAGNSQVIEGEYEIVEGAHRRERDPDRR
jgi:hypothetical protein